MPANLECSAIRENIMFTKSSCPSVCEDSFTETEKGILNRHTGIQSGETSYKFEVCSASFTNTHYALQVEETTYKCEVFYIHRVGALKRHARTHSGEKPYKCEVSYATFFEWEL